MSLITFNKILTSKLIYIVNYINYSITTFFFIFHSVHFTYPLPSHRISSTGCQYSSASKISTPNWQFSPRTSQLLRIVFLFLYWLLIPSEVQIEMYISLTYLCYSIVYWKKSSFYAKFALCHFLIFLQWYFLYVSVHEIHFFSLF